MTPDQQRETAVEAALGKLDLTAKVALLAGADMWSLPADDDIGLGRLVMSDGPAGVRGENWTPDDPSVSVPSPTALAAAWSPELAHRTGQLLAQEARRKGAHVVLAPTVNLHRSPRGGRHFEAYSEDPLLTGELGAAFVSGVQSGGVGTTPKHFVANDSETDRFTVDVRVDERTLRELYLAPFEAIVRKASPWGLMAAYNKVNGDFMTEHQELNNDVLRGEWGFDGMLVSDWTGARDTVRDALAGLDVAMPGPGTVYGEHLVRAVRDGLVPEETVDGLARRVLRLAARVGLLEGAPAAVPAEDLPAPIDGEALAREVAAAGMVLLANDGVLPLGGGSDQGIGTIALIGQAAQEARIGGGGSAQVFPTHVVSPLEGLRSALPQGAALAYAVGADPNVHLRPLAARTEARFLGRDGAELGTASLPDGAARWIGQLPAGLSFADLAAVELTGTLRPGRAGLHRLGIRGVGRFVLEADGAVLFDDAVRPEGEDPAAAFLNPPERVFDLEVADAGAPVTLRLRHVLPESGGFAGFGLVSFTLGHGEPVGTADELLEEAVSTAAAADVAVVVVGTTEEVESEGVDRVSLALPGRQDELVARIAEANPRTVVVVNAGAPVLMPWRDRVAAVLLAWFPGQEAGAALADVLTGAREPGGRLPTTWPADEADVPVGDVEPVEGRLDYAEGLFVGYRAWQRPGSAAPAYWFGHGLGYTEWTYEGLDVRVLPAPTGDDPYAAAVEAVVRLRNTGARAGREVVQLYLSPDGSDASRPRTALAGFAAVTAEPGEQAEARVRVPLRAFQTWTDGTWTARPSVYRIQAGRSVADLPLTVTAEVPLRG
ncbi:beta-glucosidase family protein [Streptacidiphilus melanogenes]|uniref:beta-glucosidase family protein n=1 Tax=Streptacidiphilus melanogenes TaxID=411235 RepID=UPI0005A8E506|nr:glycoside hydrolase family 3 C-terminal domain-containing protein [Streptacidiphilus melanogenes]